ncbi:MAG: hypothetical protein IPK52_27510 [Chloroflexi bacterium]|nr:hypothetical protein [Chloroflexota bacterium]
MLSTNRHSASRPQTINVRLPARHSGQRQLWQAVRHARVAIAPCGRGFGKSEEFVRELADDALAGLQCHYGAPDYRRVEEVYDRLYRALLPTIDRKVYAQRIDLITGGRIEFWTLKDKTAGQSRHPDRWTIDEAGLVPYLGAIVEDSIMPSLTSRKGILRISGTPKGQNDYFHFWNKAHREPEWAYFQATSYGNPMIDRNELDRLKPENGGMTENRYRQEILAEFLEDGAGVFRYVRRAVYGPQPSIADLAGRQIVIGVDLGKINDYTVFAALDLTTGQIVRIDRMQGDYTSQLARLRDLCAIVKPSTLIIETNTGQMFIEEARRMALPVVGFTTTAATKQPLIERLALAFEHQTIGIPDDAVLISELMAYESERLPGGSVRYSAPDGQHDDTVMAVALAWYAMRRGERTWGERSIYE